MYTLESTKASNSSSRVTTILTLKSMRTAVTNGGRTWEKKFESRKMSHNQMSSILAQLWSTASTTTAFQSKRKKLVSWGSSKIWTNNKWNNRLCAISMTSPFFSIHYSTYTKPIILFIGPLLTQTTIIKSPKSTNLWLETSLIKAMNNTNAYLKPIWWNGTNNRWTMIH